MANAEIGVIGLTVMGANLALNIADNGYKVAVFNRTYQKTLEFMESAGDLADQLVPCETLEEFVAAIRPPRPVIIMVKAGEPVDMAAAQEQLDLFGQWMASESTEQKTAIWQQMLGNYTDQVFSIGIVNNSRQPVVVSSDLRNVPEAAVYSWEPTAYFGAFRPDTFWFDR